MRNGGRAAQWVPQDALSINAAERTACSTTRHTTSRTLLHLSPSPRLHGSLFNSCPYRRILLPPESVRTRACVRSLVRCKLYCSNACSFDLTSRTLARATTDLPVARAPSLSSLSPAKQNRFLLNGRSSFTTFIIRAHSFSRLAASFFPFFHRLSLPLLQRCQVSFRRSMRVEQWTPQ